MRKKFDKNGDYRKAKLLKDRFEYLSHTEKSKQHLNMKLAQENELMNIETA